MLTILNYIELIYLVEEEVATTKPFLGSTDLDEDSSRLEYGFIKRICKCNFKNLLFSIVVSLLQ